MTHYRTHSDPAALLYAKCVPKYLSSDVLLALRYKIGSTTNTNQVQFIGAIFGGKFKIKVGPKTLKLPILGRGETQNVNWKHNLSALFSGENSKWGLPFYSPILRRSEAQKVKLDAHFSTN